MANDSTGCIYFALWVYILVRTVGMYIIGLNPFWASWPILTFTIFTVTRIIESSCLNIKIYVLVIVPINVGLFACGICTFFFCADCIEQSMVIFLIVFCLQSIQMLIFICIISIYCIEEINLRRNGYYVEPEYEEGEEPLINPGLNEDEIREIVMKKPNNLKTEDTCSICLCDFGDEKEVIEFETCKHNFHEDWIKGWLPRSSRWPNCNTDVRSSLLAINS